MDALRDLLQSRFGLAEFRPGQIPVLESVMKRQDTLAVMPTGGGKSLCYQIPALHFDGLVIVISPLIALMKDQVRSLTQLGIPAGCLHSGQDVSEKRQVFAAIQKNPAFILYLSPERVQNAGFADWVRGRKIVLFAIDEAHCVSQWGPDFRQDYHRLSLLRELQPEVPILALTATATPTVLNDVAKRLQLRAPARHVHGFYRSNLFYQIELCPDEDHRLRMLEEAIERTPEGRIIVYGGTRNRCEELAAHLQIRASKVGYYHAGMSAEARKDMQERVDRGEIRILVATNAFGMGVDYPDVRLVVHVQMPANIESLYQEMGRAGRDGQMSRCLLLYAKKDRGLHSYFITQSKAEPNVIQSRWNALRAITEYLESAECRHSGILTYFRDAKRINDCGHCDVCAPESDWVIRRPPDPEVPFTTKCATRKAKRKPAYDEFAITNSEAEARALILKDWRKRYAKERDVPAFVVFSDKTLRDLANKNPATLSDLLNVYGMGPAKLELFGHDLLKELGRMN